MPAPSAAENRRPRSGYLANLTLRRQAAAIRQQTAYGLVMGWLLLLVAGFIYFCVPSRVDWLWALLMVVGGMHLAAAVTIPQSLAWPQSAWIALARWQGWLVMSIVLTIIYFALIWPAGRFSRRRTSGFVGWDEQPPPSLSAWQPIDSTEADFADSTTERYRSLPLLLAGVIGFFFRRGDYLLVPIVILLLLLGLVLYFVQTSALAPFLYTFF
jgi:Family of unknown function (DUF5989)